MGRGLADQLNPDAISFDASLHSRELSPVSSPHQRERLIETRSGLYRISNEELDCSRGRAHANLLPRIPFRIVLIWPPFGHQERPTIPKHGLPQEPHHASSGNGSRDSVVCQRS
jgi:hypothetical protein